MITKPSFLKNRHIYPECYIPEKLLDIFEGNHKELIEEYKPKFEVRAPLSQPKEPDKPHFSETIKALLGMCIIGLFFRFEIFATLIVIFLLIAVIHLIVSKHNYPKLLSAYNSELISFKEEQLKFENEESKFKKELELYNSNVSKFQYLNTLKVKKLIETFAKSPNPNIYAPSPQKGKSELFFEKYLDQYFGEAIKKDCTIEIFQYNKKIDDSFNLMDGENYIEVENSYVPDFCFIHPTKGLKVDIEIDEPYTYQKPIHYLGSDNKRNKYFTDKNWFVLRFSEQQVLKAPKECCREIAEVIYDFTNDAQYLIKLLSIGRLPRVEKWNFEDTKHLISQQHRQRYLDLNQPSICTDIIEGIWETETITYTFHKTCIKRVIRQKGVVELGWKRKEGIFFIVRDKTNRHNIHVLWNDGLRDFFITDCTAESKLSITNKYTRDIQILKLTTSFKSPKLKSCYDQASNNSYTIDEIKELYLYETLPLHALTNNNIATEFVCNLNVENSIMLVMNRSLIEKIQNDRMYKLKLGVPKFVTPKNGSNYIRVEILDGNI